MKADKKGWASEDLDTIEQIVMANPDRVYDAREIKKTMLPHISVYVPRRCTRALGTCVGCGVAVCCMSCKGTSDEAQQ